MDTSEAGRMGAKLTNQILTTEMRSKAGKKGWRKRRAAAKAKKVLQ